MQQAVVPVRRWGPALGPTWVGQDGQAAGGWEASWQEDTLSYTALGKNCLQGPRGSPPHPLQPHTCS